MEENINSERLDLIRFILLRKLRDIRDLSLYPLWLLRNCPAPDNHIYKRRRIIKVENRYSCETFIETGTFYGQTVSAVKDIFKKTLSVELFQKLYQLNRISFSKFPQVKIYYGDSSVEMQNMLKDAEGRILFWLDGHYSGAGTACGSTTSPIISELEMIRKVRKRDHCILIDDARLFTGSDGYPTLDHVKRILLEINPKYHVTIDRDCIMALP